MATAKRTPEPKASQQGEEQKLIYSRSPNRSELRILELGMKLQNLAFVSLTERVNRHKGPTKRMSFGTTILDTGLQRGAKENVWRLTWVGWL